MKTIAELNGTSLDFSQGIPSGSVISSISSKLKGKVCPWFSWLQMCPIGKEQSSPKCSAPRSARTFPLYHRCPPIWCFPLLSAMRSWLISLFLLYSWRAFVGSLKKMKSSTHLSMGPIPLNCRMSANVSPNRPNRPPAVAPLKQLPLGARVGY